MGARLGALVLVCFVLLIAAACGGSPGREAGATVTVTQPITVTVGEPASSPPSDTASDEPAGEGTVEEEVVESEPSEPVDTQAEVVQTKAGFSQDGESISYGVVLRNQSETQDAINVQVTVNVVGKDGTILASDSDYINVVPADTEYFHGGDTFVAGNDEADSVETIIAVERSEAASYTLPKVSSVRISMDEYLGLEVRGEVENTLDGPLSDFARIGIVAFDDAGNVVGGTFTYLNAPLPPGRKAAFSTYLSASPDNAASAEATIENEVADGALG
jgi:hypothetical protein